MNLIESLKAARRVSVPIVAVSTADQFAAIDMIRKALTNGKAIPMVAWDIINGLRGVNKEGGEEIKRRLPDGTTAEQATANPAEALAFATKWMPELSVVFFMNAQRFIDNEAVAQAILNIRDAFKSNGRTLVMTAPEIKLPMELQQDVLVLDDPLPDEKQLEEIAVEIYKSAELKKPDDETLRKIVNATRGLASFSAEQAIAMSLNKNGIDLDSLWERKRKMIESTKGLTIWRGKERLDQVRGLDNVVNYIRSFLKNVSVVVFLDEIEKMMAGADGDNTGVSQALHQYLLTYMSDREILAVLLIGPPGTGKSLLAKAAGNEAQAPVISLDVNGVKGSLVGDSEANCRFAFRTIDAVGQGRILMIATCNSIGRLSPELRSRFIDTFFVEIPDADAKTAMWEQYCKEFGLDSKQPRPKDEGWTGREIRACCRKASLRGSTLLDAGQYTIPVSTSMAETIERLRDSSHGKFLSAAKPGLYEKPTGEKEIKPTGQRRMMLNEN